MFKSILLLSIALTTAGAYADDAAHTWLDRMHRAATELNYEGVFVYLHGDQIEAMEIVHAVRGGSMKERIYSLNGETREVIRDDRQVWCYLPDKKMGVHEYRKAAERGFPGILPSRIDRLERNYRLSLGRSARIAGRRARLVTVQPKDAYRYGYRFWADEDTGLLLKADLIDVRGRTIEQYMFTQVRIGGPIDEARLAPRTPQVGLVWHGEKASHPPPKAAAGGWRATRLPRGYRLTRNLLRYVPLRNRPVRHLVYSDGLAAVSVFIEKRTADDSEPMSGLSRMGAVHAFGRLVGAYQVTVVGEAPAQTVNMIGRSVQRLPQQADP